MFFSKMAASIEIADFSGAKLPSAFSHSGRPFRPNVDNLARSFRVGAPFLKNRKGLFSANGASFGSARAPSDNLSSPRSRSTVRFRPNSLGRRRFRAVSIIDRFRKPFLRPSRRRGRYFTSSRPSFHFRPASGAPFGAPRFDVITDVTCVT